MVNKEPKQKINGHALEHDSIENLPLEVENEMGEQDGLTKLLAELSLNIRELRNDIKNQPIISTPNNSKSVISAVVGVLGVVIVIASILVSTAGDKRALELKVDSLTIEIGKQWALVENQRNRIDQLEKDKAVQTAIDSLKKGVR